MSTITKGFTFQHDVIDQMSATALHGLVDNAGITAIPMVEFSSDSHVVQVSATTPALDQGDGSLWFDTTLGFLRTKKANSRWDCGYVGPELQNGTVANLAKGAWVVSGGSGTITLCATGLWPEVIGCLTTTLAPSSKGVVRQSGIGKALVIGPITIGDVLIAAGGAPFSFGFGYARSARSTTPTAVTLGVPLGQALGSCASGITALMDVVVWR